MSIQLTIFIPLKKKKQPFHALQISETVSTKEGKIKYYMNINNI